MEEYLQRKGDQEAQKLAIDQEKLRLKRAATKAKHRRKEAAEAERRKKGPGSARRKQEHAEDLASRAEARKQKANQRAMVMAKTAANTQQRVGVRRKGVAKWAAGIFLAAGGYGDSPRLTEVRS